MTFPSSPSNYDEHVDSGARFFALNDRWRRRRIPEVTYAHSTDTDNYQMFLGSKIAHPYQMMVMECVFTTKSNTNLYALLYDVQTGAWVPKTKIIDASGFVHWGDGTSIQGQMSSDWDKSAWGGTAFYLTVRDSTRIAKAGNPQFLRMVFLRVGDNKTVVSWECHVSCVTKNAICKNYAKMHVNLDLSRITSLALVPDNGNFDDISFTVETY